MLAEKELLQKELKDSEQIQSADEKIEKLVAKLRDQLNESQQEIDKTKKELSEKLNEV